MHLSYHFLIEPEQLNQLQNWQTASSAIGIDFKNDLININQPSVLTLNYQNHSAKLSVDTTAASDVTDNICDHLKSYLIDNQILDINFNINPEQKIIYVAILTELTISILYIEVDNTIITDQHALNHTKDIAKVL